MFHRAASHLAALKKSPVFAMSRGGLELFHSNFWAFILGLDSSDLDPVDRPIAQATRTSLLTSLFGLDIPSRVWVWREKYKLDLVVIAAPEVSVESESATPQLGAKQFMPVNRKRKNQNGLPNVGAACVLVEMKLKAIPTRAQLDSYTDKLAQGLNFDLPNPIRTGEKEWGRIQVQLDNKLQSKVKLWAYPAYPGLEEEQEAEIASASAFAGAEGNAHLLLITPGFDEKVVSECPWQGRRLSEILNAMSQAVDQARRAAPSTGGGLFTSVIQDYLCSTRILCQLVEEVQSDVADFCVAGIGELRDVYSSSSGKRFIDARVHDLVGKQAYSVMRDKALERLNSIKLPPSDFVLHAETIFTRGVPGFNLEYTKELKPDGKRKRAVRLGVQVQGGCYRHFVSSSLSTDALLKEITKDVELGAWLGGESLEQGEFQEKRFFGQNKFVYREKDISGLTWVYVSQMIESSIISAAALLTSEAVRARLVNLAV